MAGVDTMDCLPVADRVDLEYKKRFRVHHGQDHKQSVVKREK